MINEALKKLSAGEHLKLQDYFVNYTNAKIIKKKSNDLFELCVFDNGKKAMWTLKDVLNPILLERGNLKALGFAELDSLRLEYYLREVSGELYEYSYIKEANSWTFDYLRMYKITEGNC